MATPQPNAAPLPTGQFDDNYQRQLQAQRYQQQQAEAAQRQRQQDEEQARQNELRAQSLALQKGQEASGAGKPFTVTDTSYTTGTGGSGGSGSSGSGSGGFGSANINIDGRYMNLLNQPMPTYTPPTLNNATQPREQLGAAGFGPPDATAHQDAAFARLKDKSGQLGQGALQSLASTLAGRGISGASGSFGRGLTDILTRTVQPLADLNVAHLGEEYDAAGRERNLAEQRASTSYQGGISQRNSDMSSQQAMNSLLAQMAQTKYQNELAARNQQINELYRLL